jgi:GTPase SAR1 family protein
MYCLFEYHTGRKPVENQPLKERLWEEATRKHGIERTRDVLSADGRNDELEFDIDCRRRHLWHLVSRQRRFLVQPRMQETNREAGRIFDQLNQIFHELKEDPNGNMVSYKNRYRKSISMENDNNDVGSLYIRVCERLLFENTNAELCRVFPNTNRQMDEWMHEQGLADEFQPKILLLIRAIEQDLRDQWLDPQFTASTKIGFIGYTNAGKSSLLNRALGVRYLDDENAAPVRSIKSTYYQLHFDRPIPFIDPHNEHMRIPVTFVDIQGHDRNRPANNDHPEAGNYLDEIRKADCDIYVLVFDDILRNEQMSWITYIERTLERKCILVRSMVDRCYLTKFREICHSLYGEATPELRKKNHAEIIRRIQQDNQVEQRQVFLTMCTYSPESVDAKILLETESLETQPFDFNALLQQLSGLASTARTKRIHALAMSGVYRVINTCFRRAYILNVLKYKIVSGIVAIVPFADKLPLFLSKKSIQEVFGINEQFRQYLNQLGLQIDNHLLQTSLFQELVGYNIRSNNEIVNTADLGRAAGFTLTAVGTVGDDIMRVIVPTASTAGRVVLVSAGLMLSLGICAWTYHTSGKHIFGYVNQICDDLIVVTLSIIGSINERERERAFPEHF